MRPAAVAVVLTMLAGALAACSSSPAHPSSSSASASASASASVLFGNDPSRIPLGGTSQAPLVWTQPSTLSGDAVAVALAAHRSAALFQVLHSGSATPSGVRIDPLLAQFYLDGAEDPIVHEIGDADVFRGAAAGTFRELVVSVTVSGDTAVLTSCSKADSTPNAGNGPSAEKWVRSTTDDAVPWKYATTLTTTSTYDCTAWARRSS